LPWWRGKNINLGLSFIIFGNLENLLWIFTELKSLWVIYRGFNQIYLNLQSYSDSSLEFKTWHNLSNLLVWTDSKRIQTLIEFELKFYSKTQWKKTKAIIHIGHTVAHALGHSQCAPTSVTAAKRDTWHACHRLNGGELLELAVEKWSTWLNLCAATPGPTRDGWEGGPHQGSGWAAETRWQDEGGWHAVDEAAGDGILLLYGQEQDMRNHEEKLAGDKKQRRELSPAVGGCHSHDPW
jgi:hypothetical protein